MALSAEISRCLGRRDMTADSEVCDRRDQCDRYMDFSPMRGAPGTDFRRVPVANWLCADGGEFFIPVPKAA